MVGSLRDFRYVDDAAQNWAIRLDESNTESASGGAAAAAPPTYGIPRNLKPRYGIFRSVDGLVTRKAVFLTPAAYAAATSTTTVDAGGVTCSLVYKRGEVLKLYHANDTGLIDGDNP
jgi:hypothetical protein